MKQPSSCVCLLAATTFGAASSTSAQIPGHGFRTTQREQQLCVSCRVDTGERPITVDAVLSLSTSVAAAKLDTVVKLPAQLAPIRVMQCLPRAVREQNFIPDEGDQANAGIEISIEGPSQSYRRWLVANDARRNRLTSLIGTWRYMAVADQQQRDELFAQFELELTREPMVVISDADGRNSYDLPAKPGAVRTSDDLGCTIRVRSYYPHFIMDHETKKPVNLSGKPVNPAVLVEIEHDDETERRWVFSKLPDFRADKLDRLPYKVVLDCSPKREGGPSDFVLATIGRANHELWRHEGAKNSSTPIRLNEAIPVPGSRYTFRISQFVPAGRLTETYVPAEGQRGMAALLIHTTDPSGGRKEIWLERGRQSVVPTVLEPMTVVFGPRQSEFPESLEGHR